MDCKIIAEKTWDIKKNAEALRALPDLPPCVTANLDSILVHTQLLCNELGLDVDMPPQEN